MMMMMMMMVMWSALNVTKLFQFWSVSIHFKPHFLRNGNFSLHHRVQNGSGAHPASYPLDTRGSFRGDKAAVAWIWPLSSTSADVKNARNYTSTPQCSFMAWCSVKTHGQLYRLLHIYPFTKFLISHCSVLWSMQSIKDVCEEPVFGLRA